MGTIRILTFPPSLPLPNQVQPYCPPHPIPMYNYYCVLLPLGTPLRVGKQLGGAKDEDTWEAGALSEILDYVTVRCRRAWLKCASAAWSARGVAWPPWTVVAKDILFPRSWELSEAECHPALLSTQQQPSVHSSPDLLMNFSFNFPLSGIMPPRHKQAFSSPLQSR